MRLRPHRQMISLDLTSTILRERTAKVYICKVHNHFFKPLILFLNGTDFLVCLRDFPFQAVHLVGTSPHRLASVRPATQGVHFQFLLQRQNTHKKNAWAAKQHGTYLREEYFLEICLQSFDPVLYFRLSTLKCWERRRECEG